MNVQALAILAIPIAILVSACSTVSPSATWVELVVPGVGDIPERRLLLRTRRVSAVADWSTSPWAGGPWMMERDA